MENIEQVETSDSLKIHKISSRKKALMLRAGGLGDILILTPIAKQLHKKGYDVDFFCGSPTGEVWKLIEALPYFNQVREISRVNNIDCIKDGVAYISIDLIRKDYDEVFDFKLSIEDNRAGFNIPDGWRSSINSNYQNWVDLSLGWANIDWTKVSDSDKLPEIAIKDSQKYDDWIATTPLADHGSKVIGVQLIASSLIRSWYRANDLPDLIHEKYPDDIVVIFVGGKWVMISKNGKVELQFPEGLDPLICSAWLIKLMDIFISADSGMSHVAEALNVQTIGIYTSVPAWTRVKYYKHAHYIESDVFCHPCFALDAFCPLEKKKAEDGLNEREKDIRDSAIKNVNIFEVAKKYQTVPQAIMSEAEGIVKKLQGLYAKMPACVANITPEMILDKLEYVINMEKI